MDAGIFENLRCESRPFEADPFRPPGPTRCKGSRRRQTDGVPQELAHQRAVVVGLKELFKLIVDDIGDQSGLITVWTGSSAA
jgi:hypothetical protein